MKQWQKIPAQAWTCQWSYKHMVERYQQMERTRTNWKGACHSFAWSFSKRVSHTEAQIKNDKYLMGNTPLNNRFIRNGTWPPKCYTPLNNEPVIGWYAVKWKQKHKGMVIGTDSKRGEHFESTLSLGKCYEGLTPKKGALST